MIDVNNESGEAVDEQALEQLARFVLRTMRIHRLADLSVVLVDEKTITSYNETFMGHTGPTDVLSFPMDELRPTADGEPPRRGMLGDVLVCPSFAAAQAARNGRTARQEIEYLMVHGILHLLGYDHAEPAEQAVMFALNDRLIADWNASRSS